MDKFDPKFPNYDDDSDYNTNANSYYKDLGRKNKLIKLLAKRIWEYDERLDNRIADLEEVLSSYLTQWDERIENLDKEVSHIFVTWLEDGTLEQIINDDVLGNKADKSFVDTEIERLDLKDENLTNMKADKSFVDTEIERLDLKDENLNEQLAHTVNVVTPNVETLTGAIGDNIADDTQTLKDIITYVESLLSNKTAVTLVFPVGYVFRTTEPIIIPPGVDVIMHSPINYDSEFSQTALTVGEPSTPNSGRNLKLFVRREQRSPWTNENDIGIKVINLYTSKLELVNSSRFTIGVQLIADDMGFAYNKIDVIELMNNKIALDLTNINGGFINENVFIGGRFWQSSTSGFGLSRYGVRITSQDEQYKNNNNNYFIKPSFELHLKGAQNGNVDGEALPILIEHGFTNEFISVRTEGNSDYVMRVENESNNNMVDIGFSNLINKIDEQTPLKTNLLSDRKNYIFDKGNVIFNSGAVHKKATQNTDTDYVGVDGLNVFNTGSPESLDEISGFTIEDDGLQINGNRGVGVRVLTDKVKKFVIKRDVGGNLGRVAIRPMSADGTNISEQSSELVTGASGNTPRYYDMFGGSYIMNVDSSKDFFIHLSDDVKMIDVIVKGDCLLKSFSIQSIDGLATTYKV